MVNAETKSKITSHLKGLAKRRSSGIVTADDVVRYMTKKGMANDKRDRLSVVNSVLRYPTFIVVGSTNSIRPESRGRRISKWAL